MLKITSSIIFKAAICIGLFSSFPACSPKAEKGDSVDTSTVWEQNDYAEKFALKSSSDSVFIKIESPVGGNDLVYAFRKYKIEEIALSNSVQWSFLKQLNNGTSVPGGIVGHAYFCDSLIHKAVTSGKCMELRGSESFDEEQMIMSNCKLLLSDGFNRKILGQSGNKPYAEFFVMEWKENHPLARLEWIKVLGALIDKEDEARTFFETKRKAYEKLRVEISNTTVQCKVMTSSPFKSEWHIPAKGSYMETLISDAGGQMLHNEKAEHVSQNLSLEDAYINFKNADVWLVNSGVESQTVLQSNVPFFNEIKAVQEGKIYNYHKSKSFGNYLFWEDGVCQPEQLLLEYNQMFTSGLESSIYYTDVTK